MLGLVLSSRSSCSPPRCTATSSPAASWRRRRRSAVTSSAALTELQAEKARWSDPAYVAQQARTRLQYAKPGETVYVVIRPGDENDETRDAPPATSTVVGDSWSARMWNSVQAADNSS